MRFPIESYKSQIESFYKQIQDYFRHIQWHVDLFQQRVQEIRSSRR